MCNNGTLDFTRNKHIEGLKFNANLYECNLNLYQIAYLLSIK